MDDNIKQYHLHKDDYSKLHFELKDAKKYVLKNEIHSSKPHRHSFYQLIWFKNKGQHYIDYQVIEHEENTLFFINKNQIHYFCLDSLNDGYLFHFNDVFIARFNSELMKRFSYSIFNEIGNPFISLSSTDAIKFETVCSLIKSEIKTKDYFHKEQVFSLVQTILFQIERLKKKQNTFGVDTNKEHHTAFLFKKIIYEHIDTFLTLDEYCSKLNINIKNLTSISKEFLLDTPANIIRQVKILEAKRILANHKTTAKEVAYALGFDQPTYFTKYFKKETGLTPKQFQTSLP